MTYPVETFTEEKSVGILHIWCKSIGFTAVTLGRKVPCYWATLSPTDFKQRWIVTKGFSRCFSDILVRFFPQAGKQR